MSRMYARAGYTEERARAILAVALSAKSCGDKVSVYPTCVNNCDAGRSTQKLFGVSAAMRLATW